MFEGGNEKGNSMYQTLVTRDTTPHGVNLPVVSIAQEQKLLSVGELHIHKHDDAGSINNDRQPYVRDNRPYDIPKHSVRSSP